MRTVRPLKRHLPHQHPVLELEDREARATRGGSEGIVNDRIPGIAVAVPAATGSPVPSELRGTTANPRCHIAAVLPDPALGNRRILDRSRATQRFPEPRIWMIASSWRKRVLRLDLRAVVHRGTKTFRLSLTPPKRGSFEPTSLVASRNLLICPASDIRTKTGVVRLQQRTPAERDGKRPEMGLTAAARGSDERARRPAFCAIAADADRKKKNVPSGETGGGKLTG
jgi:hypothetical protein